MRSRWILLVSVSLLGILAAVVLLLPSLSAPMGNVMRSTNVALLGTPTPMMTATMVANVATNVNNTNNRVPAGQGAVQPAPTRVILRNVALRLIVADPAAALNRITALVGEFGGWVVSSNTSRVALAAGGDATRGSISARVPAERLDTALAQFKMDVVKVDSETITGEDVTQNYVDASSQLINLQAAEAQLRDIMGDATETADVLSVYSELVRVRGEIEVLRGRLNYYDEASAFALVTIELIPQAVQQPIQIAGWSPGRTAETALASLVGILRGIADFLITFAIVWLPLLLILAVPGWLIMRGIRQRRRSRS